MFIKSNLLSKFVVLATIFVLSSCGNQIPVTQVNPITSPTDSPTSFPTDSPTAIATSPQTLQNRTPSKTLEIAIQRSLEQQLGSKIDSINCPPNIEFKAGNTFNCKASIQNVPFKVNVIIKDNQGNFNWQVKGLAVIDLIKVENLILTEFKKRNISVKVNCGSSQKKFIFATIKETFECKAYNDQGESKTLKVTVEDENGQVNISSN